jgi:predicted dehydrogenase
MDYTSRSLSFKVRKTLRYLRLYGLSRTLMKVRAQYHMHRTYPTLPSVDARESKVSGVGVGIVGCGNFAYSTIAYYLRKHVGRVIVGCMDKEIARAASLCVDFGGRYYTDNPKRIIDDPRISLIYIASNHATHAEYAIDAMRAGKAVHIEKPHAVSLDQLRRLCGAIRDTRMPVGLGFNRPNSRLGRILAAAVRSETGPMVMNWFVAGHELPADHWYFREEEGGRVLGNLCHWTDFILRLVPRDQRYPIRIIPARSDRSDCNIAVSFVFGEGSVGAITFSAMGHTFEGVRERFAIHRGDLIAHLDDFQVCSIERVAAKRRWRGWGRDHGHADAILKSYRAALTSIPADDHDLAYVWESGDLFLQTKKALDENRLITVEPFTEAVLA